MSEENIKIIEDSIADDAVISKLTEVYSDESSTSSSSSSSSLKNHVDTSVGTEEDSNKQAAQQQQQNTITSFSIDQVNDNPEELVELRGEGRYFGNTDTVSGPICSNCHRRGHIRSKCKVVVCHACGMVDDHYETQCPKSMVCANCGKKGHFKVNCTEKFKKTFCTLCDSKNHSDDRCPSIWRSYITLSNNKMNLPVIYCYNCGREGHYGDECRQFRSSKTPNIDGSCFSGNNLPKNLRNVYFNTLRKISNNNNNNIGNKKRRFEEEENKNRFHADLYDEPLLQNNNNNKGKRQNNNYRDTNYRDNNYRDNNYRDNNYRDTQQRNDNNHYVPTRTEYLSNNNNNKRQKVSNYKSSSDTLTYPRATTSGRLPGKNPTNKKNKKKTGYLASSNSGTTGGRSGGKYNSRY